MIELLNKVRIEKLRRQYSLLKEEAKRLLMAGDISAYAPKLVEVSKVRTELHRASNERF